jgi:glutathione synthase/RimK-type ligase-like ATP-grasp enzyme
MILIISSLTQDDHCRPVMDEIARQGGEYVLLDLSEYPIDLRLAIAYDGDGAAPAYRLRRDGPGGDLRLADCRVAWWRRPQNFTLNPAMTQQAHRNFAYQEVYQAINGLWLLLDVTWVNHPTRDDEAARKAYQLKIARELGLETPATLITSDPEAARAFVAQHGPERTVYKSFLASVDAWRETRLLKPDEVALLDNVAHAPVIFQEYVPADLDLRIAVMGDQIFPSAVDTRHTDYHVDYRMTMERGYVTPHTLPPELARQLRAYLDRLGLVYGAIDMRLTPDGRYVFLEVNPAGQWRFMEERTGVPMTEAFARMLIEKDRA